METQKETEVPSTPVLNSRQKRKIAAANHNALLGTTTLSPNRKYIQDHPWFAEKITELNERIQMLKDDYAKIEFKTEEASLKVVAERMLQTAITRITNMYKNKYGLANKYIPH